MTSPRQTFKFTVERSRQGLELKDPKPNCEGRVIRLARLLALGYHFSDLINKGEVASMASLSRLAGLSRARVTQIVDLTLLAPQIQEEILFWPLVQVGADPIVTRQVIPIAQIPLWKNQIAAWEKLKARRKSQTAAAASTAPSTRGSSTSSRRHADRPPAQRVNVRF